MCFIPRGWRDGGEEGNRVNSRTSSSDKTSRLQYEVRFDAAGRVLGDSLHSELGEQLGIAVGDHEEVSIFEYLERIVVLEADLPGRLARRVRKLLDTHGEFSLSGDFKRGTQTHHLHISGRAIHNRDGAMVFSLLFQDDTQHTQIRRVYEYMFRLANHELKSPLTCILGAVEYAEDHVAAGNLDGVRTCLEMIERNGRSMEDMLARYLNLSRIESGILRVVPADLRISEDVLNPLTREFHPALQRKGMAIDFECRDPGHEPTVYADAEMVEIVLRNLISNAIKYGRPNTTIRIVMTPAEEGFEIAVENEGPNIPAPYLNKLFDKFIRLDSTQGTKGSGLGLYNSRKVVELWGGNIWVESDEKTTRFTFTVPEA